MRKLSDIENDIKKLELVIASASPDSVFKALLQRKLKRLNAELDAAKASK